jgi:hypothetical protein
LPADHMRAQTRAAHCHAQTRKLRRIYLSQWGRGRAPLAHGGMETWHAELVESHRFFVEFLQVRVRSVAHHSCLLSSWIRSRKLEFSRGQIP